MSRPGLPRPAAVAISAGAGVLAIANAVLEHRAGIPYYAAVPDALVGWAYITGGMVAYRVRRLDRTGTLMTAIGVIWNLGSVSLYVHALLPYAAWLGGLSDVLLAQLLLQYPSRALRSRLEPARRAGCQLFVEITDDGIGGAPTHGGSGLTGLADRVAALGGQLTVTSPPGRGTSIRAELPCG